MAVERKYERDVDLLLAEELLVSPHFAAWLWSAAGLPGTAGRIVDIFVSKADNLGESDLIALYEAEDGSRLALMVEDKVDAPLQHEQANRYRQRAAGEIASGACASYRLILCAPRYYLENVSGAADFDAAVAFEDIADFFRRTNDARATYRAEFLETAAKRRANNWKREIDPATEAFWDAAYRLASREFPILEMKPLKVTKDSSWINFRPRDMPTSPKRIYISVKADRGQMDLTFSTTLAYRFHPLVESILDKDMTIHQTTGSTAIRLGVRPFHPSESAEAATQRIRDAFSACARLIAYYREHREALDAAANQASA